MKAKKQKQSDKPIITPEDGRAILSLILSDTVNLSVKIWNKFKAGYAGASFLNLHFTFLAANWVSEPARFDSQKLSSYNLFWFVIYTYFVGIVGVTWIIFIPVVSNASSLLASYALGLVKRSRQ